MRKFLSVAVSLSLVLSLATGIAWAKPKDNAKTELEKGKEKSKIEFKLDKSSTKIKAPKESKAPKAPKSKKLKELKQKLDTTNAESKKINFKDVKGHWAKSYIDKMSAIGVFKGYEDFTFRPDNPITQVETVSLVMRITDTTNINVSVQGAVYGVPDWAQESVQEAVYKNIINLNRFHSQVQATRAQTAVMVAKAMGLQPVDTSSMPFKDGILISPEDAGYILALYQNGIVKGTPDGKFNPNSSITRAEMSTIMEKVIELQGGEDSSDQSVDTAQNNDTQDNSTDS